MTGVLEFDLRTAFKSLSGGGADACLLHRHDHSTPRVTEHGSPYTSIPLIVGLLVSRMTVDELVPGAFALYNGEYTVTLSGFRCVLTSFNRQTARRYRYRVPDI